MSGTAGRLVAELSTSGVAQVDADFARLEGRLGTLAGAQRKYEQDVALVQRTMEKNPALIERGTQALDALHASFQRGSGSASGFSNAMGELGGGLTSLSSRLGPVGGALSAFGPAGIAAAAGLGVLSVGLAQVARAGDDMVASLGRIRSATGSVEQAAVVYDRLYQLSLQTGQSVSDSVAQFQRFAIATKEVGATNDQAIRLVETLQKAAIVGGASGQEAAAGALQLGQALASGVLQGDELRSLLEAMPNLAVALARELGVGVGELRKMGSEGTLTADRVMPALLRAGEAINAEYEKMPVTMARAFDQLTVASGNFLARMDQAIGLSQRLAQGLAASARLLNGVTASVLPSAAERETARSTELSNRADYLRSRISAAEATGPSLTAPTGGYARRAQIVGNRNAGGDLAADMRAELEQVEKQLRDSNAARLSLLREGREDEQAEAADAAAKRLENQRTQNARRLEALKVDQDKEYAARQAWSKRVAEINALIDKPGGVSAAEAQRLVALATTERDEALKKLDGTARTEAAARSAESRARREALKAEKEAAADALKIYDQLRVSTRSELLLGSDGDARTEQAALAKLRGTALDPDVQKRAREKIDRDRKTAEEKQQRDIETSTNSIVEYSASRFADLFEKNGTGWKGMLETFESTAKTTFARIAAEAVVRPVITPIVTTVMGGSSALAGAAGASGNAGGIAGAVSQLSLSDYASLGMKLSGGSALGSTGFGFVDNALSSTVWSSGSQGAATNTALGQMGGAYGPATPAAVQGAGYSSISAGQALAGGASIVGGAYGIYQGFQTGGAKGWAQGVSGAAGVAGGAAGLASAAGIGGAAMAGIATVAPYVAIAALVASYFLSGQKPSDKTGVFRSNLQTGVSDVTGLEGDRFSQENRDLAANLGKSVADMASSLRGALGVSQTPFRFEIAAGARDGLVASYGGRERQYGNDEAGAKQLVAEMTTALIDSMREMASAEVQSVLRNSSGIEATLANLDWYNSTYKSFVDSVDPAKVSSFAAAQKALNDQYAPMIQKAAELGLSLAPITASLTKQLEAMNKVRVDQFDTTINGMLGQAASLRGGNQLGAQLQAFDKQRTTDWEALVAQILDQGFDQNQVNDAWSAFIPLKELQRQQLIDQDRSAKVSSRNTLLDQLEAANGTANTEAGALAAFDRNAEVRRTAAARDGVTDMVLLEQTLAEQRLKISRDYAVQATDLQRQRADAELAGLQTLKAQSETLRGFLDSQAVSGAGVSPQQAFLAAQQQFQDALASARNGGDLGAYTTAANNLLNANSNYNATGEQASMMREMVLSTTRSLGATLNLPGFSDNLTAGLERVMTPNTDALTKATQEIAGLKEEFRTWRMRGGQ